MLRVCLECETAYAADLDKCPHCGGAGFCWNYELEGVPVPAAAKRKRVAP